MIITFKHQGQTFHTDLSKPIDISIPLQSGDDNPNCFFAEPVSFNTIRAGDFIGSIKEGGAVNYQQVVITPHGNGTHTECYGHITDTPTATVNRCLNRFHYVTALITLTPQQLESGDEVIPFSAFEKAWPGQSEAVIIRTLPNDNSKKVKRYSGKNPPYLDHRIADFLCGQGVAHLLIDLPSVDKESDGGELKAHRAFWGINTAEEANRKSCTITELIYAGNEIPDGLYLLNLQITSMEIDASLSKPVIFKLTSVNIK